MTDLAEVLARTKDLAADLAGPLARLSVSCGEATVVVEWQPHNAGEQPQPPPPPAQEPDETDEHAVIRSPIVGTFYRAPSPDTPPFVEVGDAVEPGQTVAIVEAMKLLNPIVAEESGVVAEVLVANEQPVEFDQPLLRLKKG
jgi:acetyl-CoA carboxylase biotin carboxyl carrier protein